MQLSDLILESTEMVLELAFLYPTVQSFIYLFCRFIIYIFKGYLAFYILSCCHEVLEDHREGTVNARSKSVHMMISSLMISLTGVGLYGVFASHFGLFFTWLLLKPFVRILELESAAWTTLVISVFASGWTLCYWTYETIGVYTPSLLL